MEILNKIKERNKVVISFIKGKKITDDMIDYIYYILQLNAKVKIDEYDTEYYENKKMKVYNEYTEDEVKYFYEFAVEKYNDHNIFGNTYYDTIRKDFNEYINKEFI